MRLPRGRIISQRSPYLFSFLSLFLDDEVAVQNGLATDWIVFTLFLLEVSLKVFSQCSSWKRHSTARSRAQQGRSWNRGQSQHGDFIATSFLILFGKALAMGPFGICLIWSSSQAEVEVGLAPFPVLFPFQLFLLVLSSHRRKSRPPSPPPLSPQHSLLPNSAPWQ